MTGSQKLKILRERILSKRVKGEISCETCPAFDVRDKDCKHNPRPQDRYPEHWCAQHPLYQKLIKEFLND